MEKWYRNEEEWARQVAASWLGHPAVRVAVETAAPKAGEIVAPLARHLLSQVEITRFCWQVCGIGPSFPDGTVGPNPFDPAAPGAWLLTEEEREAAGYIAAAFHQLVKLIVQVLDRAEVHVDAPWGSDQALIAVLLLLVADGYEMTWDNPVVLADELQPPGVSAISPDGRTTSARDGRSEVMARNADRIRKLVREQAGGREFRRPYAAATGRRAQPRPTVIRRQLLKELIADKPDVTVQLLRTTWDHSDRTAGGWLRRELTRRLASEGFQAPSKPSKTTLSDDFRALKHCAD